VQKQRVLLVDDDPSIHDLIGVSLASEAIELLAAYDGPSALTMAASLRPDLILLDVELSSTNGFEVCRQLKRDPLTAAVPLVFITSAAGTAEKIQGLDLGAADYITKPFDQGEARARILAALRSKHLQDLLARNANVDPLTGTGNRRYFDQRAATELSRSRRHNQPLACIMLDIDHFKHVNDTYGHPFGDEVLRQLGQLLADDCRAEDIVCRYGGEEFVILTPGMDQSGAAVFAERLRHSIEELQFTCAGTPVKVTCSLGVAGVDPFTKSSGDLVGRADKALYEAKHGGRNCVGSAASRSAPAESPATAAPEAV
jgi:diguanylate cyclase (GGDEF)-like protein